MSDLICPEGARLIPLGSKKWPGRYAIVDEADFERVSQYKWTCREAGTHNKIYYAYRNATKDEISNGSKSGIALHRFLMGDIGDLHVDHINHDGLDNRKSNMRAVTHAENMGNKRPPVAFNHPRQTNSSSSDYDRRRPFTVSLVPNRTGFPRYVAGINMFDKRCNRVSSSNYSIAIKKKYEGEIIRRASLESFGL